MAVNFGPKHPRQISDFVVSAAPMHSEELLICMSFFIWSKDPPHLHFNNLKVSHNYFINCGYFRPLNLCAISFLEFFNLLEARVLSFYFFSFVIFCHFIARLEYIAFIFSCSAFLLSILHFSIFEMAFVTS